ncbi:repeat protein [Eubacterium saphenum ATCC 49989]|nr:repeat protein [Eubacterium saphenum ATCC 49989]
MKNSELNRKNVGAAGIASKACAWILSIMLVVTGMAPSFAANKAATKAGRGKVQTAVSNAFPSFYKNTKSSSKISKKNFDKASLKNKAVKSIKNEARNAKTPNEAKGKEDKNGKQNKIKNKRGQTFNLNFSGNVYAEFDGNENLIVSAKNTSGDMNIKKEKWRVMREGLKASKRSIKGASGWKRTKVKNIRFNTNGIYLPEYSEYFFNELQGKIDGCENLNTSKVKRMNNMFEKAPYANPDVSKWDVSNVNNMNGMFYMATSANPDVSKWNVSNATYMIRMFQQATSANPDVSGWEVSNVDNMNWMFYGATSANPDVSKWNVSKATYMNGMFEGATLANPDVSRWDTSEVTDMRNMFNGATSANPDVSKWNVSKVAYMNGMFGGATSANPNVSGWDTSKVTNMSYMFEKSGIKKINLSKWKLNEEVLKDNNTEGMFSGCSKLEYLKTPAGMRTNISVAGDEDFKIVLLRKGESPVVEKESENLKNGYIINNNNNRDVLTHIYRKDKYVGVVFDKNGGNYEGWMNHEIVSKDKNIKDSKGVLPETKPEREGHKFLGWSKSKTATAPDFDENTIVNGDITAYAVWAAPKVSITFYKNGGEGDMQATQVEKGSEYQLPECAFTAPAGKEFDKWEVRVGIAKAVEKIPNDKIIASADVKIKALWKTKPVPKVVVTLDSNGGVLAGGASATVAVDKGSAVKEQLEAAVANKIFTKDGYRLIGFSKSKFATQADYNLDSPVYLGTTLYAVYEETNEVTKLTIKYTEVGMDEDEVIENVPTGKPIGDKLDGHERALAGHRFLGYSKEKNAVKPDFFKKSIVTNNLVLYPVYKETGNVDKAKVAFKLNDGTDGSLKTQEVTKYESLGDKMPTKDKVPARDGYLFTGWAKSKAARYPDFFRGTTVKGDMTVYAVWKSLYDERLGQAVLKVSVKAKGYELTIEPPTANLHTGFEIFRSEKKDFKPSKDNMIATVDRDALKYLDEKADNGKAYYYAVRAIDADGSYNGTKVTYIGKLSDKVLAASLPKDRGVTATVTGKGVVGLEFNKTIAAIKYKVTVTAPYDKKFKTIERFVEADKLMATAEGKVKANITRLPMGKFLTFKLEALEADNTKLVEYGNSFAFMMGAVDKLTAKVNKKSRVLNIKFKAMKGASGYEVKIVINGKVKTIKLKKGKKKLKNFMVGSIKLPKKKGKYTFTIRAFKKIGKLKYYGQAVTKTVK